jgi:tetratricopeptide (TPR) repeat protein
MFMKEHSRASDLSDLAESLRREGRLSEALEAVERCLQENQSHPRALLLRGRILYQANRYAQALETLGSLEGVLGSDEELENIMSGMNELLKAPSSKMNPAFITETMAELYIRQGYLWEATEIYRQLYLGSKREDRLWRRILDLRDRLQREKSRDSQEERDAQRLEALNLWIENERRGS